MCEQRAVREAHGTQRRPEARICSTQPPESVQLCVDPPPRSGPIAGEQRLIAPDNGGRGKQCRYGLVVTYVLRAHRKGVKTFLWSVQHERFEIEVDIAFSQRQQLAIRQ